MKVPALVVVTDDGVDWAVVREVWPRVHDAVPLAVLSVRTRKLDGAALVALCRALPSVVVSRRADVAKAAGVGLHLPSSGIPTHEARGLMGDALILRAAHDVDEARRCAGADAMLLSPFHPTISKPHTGKTLTDDEIRACLDVAGTPCIALGGITPHTARLARARGAAGVAIGARFFQERDPVDTARRLVGD